MSQEKGQKPKATVGSGEVKRSFAEPSQVRALPAALPHQPATFTRAVGEILSFGLWMEKEGYRPATTRCAVEALKSVSRRVDIFDTRESLVGYLNL